MSSLFVCYYQVHIWSSSQCMGHTSTSSCHNVQYKFLNRSTTKAGKSHHQVWVCGKYHEEIWTGILCCTDQVTGKVHVIPEDRSTTKTGKQHHQDWVCGKYHEEIWTGILCCTEQVAGSVHVIPSWCTCDTRWQIHYKDWKTASPGLSLWLISGGNMDWDPVLHRQGSTKYLETNLNAWMSIN